MAVYNKHNIKPEYTSKPTEARLYVVPYTLSIPLTLLIVVVAEDVHHSITKLKI